ncbi:DUF2929 domain-containing protein [Bacillus sp. V3-13]|uniref:YjzD family protein n=1 Tax=Bacillus sp. V3-13 TaxID=2053728 RepID=UPI000C78BE09|nr:YjzD family protein [Bacillus sp. V3-13]PLR78840.1 DUF2929 domain-containing protein [Bacillus sp. V3-13]
MRYFWTFFWTFLLIQMLNYVTGSMMGAEFDLKAGSILAVIVTVLIIVVSQILPNDPVEKH